MKKNVKSGITTAMHELANRAKSICNALQQGLQNDAPGAPIKSTFERNLRFTVGCNEWNWRERPYTVLSARETKELLTQVRERGGINVVFIGQGFDEYHAHFPKPDFDADHSKLHAVWCCSCLQFGRADASLWLIVMPEHFLDDTNTAYLYYCELVEHGGRGGVYIVKMQG